VLHICVLHRHAHSIAIDEFQAAIASPFANFFRSQLEAGTLNSISKHSHGRKGSLHRFISGDASVLKTAAGRRPGDKNRSPSSFANNFHPGRETFGG
jgi:hypothetical protein